MLIVEDDPDIVLGCEQALQLEGIATESAPAQRRARGWGVIFGGVVVSDIRLPQMDGMAFLQEIMRTDPELPVVLITGHGDISMAVQAAMKDGAHDFIQKPFTPEQLVSAVRRALDKRRLVLEVRDLRSQLAQRDAIERLVMGPRPTCGNCAKCSGWPPARWMC